MGLSGEATMVELTERQLAFRIPLAPILTVTEVM